VKTNVKLVAFGGIAALFILSLPGVQPFFSPLGLTLVAALTVGPLLFTLAGLAFAPFAKESR
jgi:hypothetical protein